MAIIILSLVVEFCTSEMVSIWFCGGAIISCVLSALNLPWFIHLPVFIIVSGALLLCFRKIVLKFFDKGESRTNAQAVIGKEYELLTGIGFNKPGTIRINDVTWNAVTENEKQELEAGTIVRIVCLKGNKYIVEEIK
jgi:membrane protein implicated in regulation of membrane protease activity